MINNTQVSAVIRFATREEGVSFSSHPDKINAQLYVHENGDIDRLGVSIAKSLNNQCSLGITCEIDNLDWLIGNRIDNCLYDIDYIYYVWQARGKSTWISIFETRIDYTDEACPTCGSPEYGEPIYKDKCIFVGTPDELLDKLDISYIDPETGDTIVDGFNEDLTDEEIQMEKDVKNGLYGETV